MRERPKSPELLEAFGRFVDSLGGAYITAEDVGASVADMEVVATADALRERSAAHRGRCGRQSRRRRRRSASTSASRRPCNFSSVAADLRGVTVAVQGLGGVGYALVRTARGGRREAACGRHPAGARAARVQRVRRRCLDAERNPVRARRRAVALRARRRVRRQHHSATAGDDHRGRREQPAGDRRRTARACTRPACCTHRTM